MYKADFHTHSIASPDGALTTRQYSRMLESARLDYIAVTDHDTIEMAQKLHAELGDRIIVGEEITALEGEIIGLYLQKTIPAGLTVLETARQIHAQGGLVYIPHPFETVRKGVSHATLDALREHVDIIEVYNGRAVFQDRTDEALDWATQNRVPYAASSDAHGFSGWGRTCTMLNEPPTPVTLVGLLADANYQRGFPGVRGVAYPKFNRLRKWRRHA